MATATATVLSIDEYFDLPETAGVQRELLNGRLVEVPAPTLLHAAIQVEIGFILRGIVGRSFPHLIVASHSEFLVDGDSGQAPDVFLLDRERRRQMSVYRGALRGAPDLAVEIISPSEAADDVDEKVELYLKAGSQTVWVVWPKTSHVLIHHAGGEVRKAELDSYLDAPSVLGDARIPVRDIFPNL